VEADIFMRARAVEPAVESPRPVARRRKSSEQLGKLAGTAAVAAADLFARVRAGEVEASRAVVPPEVDIFLRARSAGAAPGAPEAESFVRARGHNPADRARPEMVDGDERRHVRPRLDVPGAPEHVGMLGRPAAKAMRGSAAEPARRDAEARPSKTAEDRPARVASKERKEVRRVRRKSSEQPVQMAEDAAVEAMAAEIQVSLGKDESAQGL
jgi:hypothetical protein